MSNNNFQPEGYNLGRDVQLNTIASSGGFLSEPVRNFRIEQSGTNFYFRRWQSSQSNYNIFPYAIDATASGQKQTRISNPIFTLDTGEFYDDKSARYPYTWIYLKSTATDSNDEELFYKSNATTRGMVSKVAGGLTYTFSQIDIHNAVKLNDFVYLSFVNSNADMTVDRVSFVAPYTRWFGSFFKVTKLGVNSIELQEDVSIFTTLFPGNSINNFAKSYPVGSDLNNNYCILYDLGYCFQRPGLTDYLRPIDISVDTNKFGYKTFEYNGLIYTSDNLNTAKTDSYDNSIADKEFVVISFLAPLCRQIMYKLRPQLSLADDPYLIFSPLGSDTASALSGVGMECLMYQPNANSNMWINRIDFIRGIPIIFFQYMRGSAAALISRTATMLVAADYLGRI